MHCSKARKMLQLYLDKRLTLDQVRALEAHLSDCFSCHEELLFLEEIEQAFHGVEFVEEPTDFTINVMRRVAMSAQQVRMQTVSQSQSFEPFRPSFSELLSVILLATVAVLGLALDQPMIRSALPFVNKHDAISSFLVNIWASLSTMNSQMLVLCLVSGLPYWWLDLICGMPGLKLCWIVFLSDNDMYAIGED